MQIIFMTAALAATMPITHSTASVMLLMLYLFEAIFHQDECQKEEKEAYKNVFLLSTMVVLTVPDNFSPVILIGTALAVTYMFSYHDDRRPLCDKITILIAKLSSLVCMSVIFNTIRYGFSPSICLITLVWSMREIKELMDSRKSIDPFEYSGQLFISYIGGISISMAALAYHFVTSESTAVTDTVVGLSAIMVFAITRIFQRKLRDVLSAID